MKAIIVRHQSAQETSSSNKTALKPQAASPTMMRATFFWCIKEVSDNHGTTTSSTRLSCPTSSCKRLQRWQRQLIATRAQNCATTANSPLMWINRIDDCKGAKHQWFDWSWRLDNNVDDATIISYCHIVRSDDNNRQMQGKIKQTPTQQSKFHVVVRKMQRQPYHAM